MAHQRRRVSVAESPHEQPISEDAIRNRAHELYEQRGSEPGHELEHWLQAERELRSEREQDERRSPARP